MELRVGRSSLNILLLRSTADRIQTNRAKPLQEVLPLYPLPLQDLNSIRRSATPHEAQITLLPRPTALATIALQLDLLYVE